MVTFLERTTQRSSVEALARAADLEPTFVSVPRERIRKAGGQLIGRDLYFGEYLDLPPHTEIVEKAPRLLGVAPTPLETALAAGFEWYLTQPRRESDYAFEDRILGSA